MEKLRSLYKYLKEKYALLTQRKYTTLAGTLVYFFDYVHRTAFLLAYLARR